MVEDQAIEHVETLDEAKERVNQAEHGFVRLRKLGHALRRVEAGAGNLALVHIAERPDMVLFSDDDLPLSELVARGLREEFETTALKVRALGFDPTDAEQLGPAEAEQRNA